MQISDRYTVTASIMVKHGGAILTELQGEDIIITKSSAAEIKTSMSCFIRYHPEINLLSDRLCPIQVVNGITYPMGEYLIATATYSNELGRKGWQVDAYDLSQSVKQTSAQQRYYLAQGTSYASAIQSMLMECGIVRAIIEPSTLTLAAEREWEPGTNYLTILNALLKEINYGSLWFDREGVARIEKVKQEGAGKPIVYLPNEYSMIKETITNCTDAFEAYNVFTAVVSSPDYPPMSATAINDSPLSPVSTVNRGRRICAPIQYLDAISSQEELNIYVKRLAHESMWGHETVSFETLPVPEHWHEDTIILAGGTYLETDWEITLGFGGTYTHSAQKQVKL